MWGLGSYFDIIFYHRHISCVSPTTNILFRTLFLRGHCKQVTWQICEVLTSVSSAINARSQNIPVDKSTSGRSKLFSS